MSGFISHLITSIRSRNILAVGVIFAASLLLLIVFAARAKLGWRSFQSEELQLSFNYPASWLVEEFEGGVRVIETDSSITGMEILVYEDEIAAPYASTEDLITTYLLDNPIDSERLLDETPIVDYSTNDAEMSMKRFLLKYQSNVPYPPQYEIDLIALRENRRNALIILSEDKPDWSDGKINARLETILESLHLFGRLVQS